MDQSADDGGQAVDKATGESDNSQMGAFSV